MEQRGKIYVKTQEKRRKKNGIRPEEKRKPGGKIKELVSPVRRNEL